MEDKDLLKNIADAILSFANSNEHMVFEKFVTENLTNSKEKVLFNSIWLATLKFENWNYADLQTGYNHTVQLLKSKYALDENVCKLLANAGAYQWK
ncbi:MAG: hypothetical protein V4580_04070 [Bacteroidota bacterium]